MDNCIQFNGLSPKDRARVLEMAKRTPAFWILCDCEEQIEANGVEWLIAQTAEHLTHMNTISGGKYGTAELDV